MIRWFLWFCIFLVVGGLLALLIQQGSGYVLLVWGKTSIEMSLWFGFIVLLTLVLILWLILYLLRGSLRTVGNAHKKIIGYSSNRAQKQTTEGLIQFIEGNWLPAYKKLTKAANSIDSPVINYLAASRCAYELGRHQDALQLLHKAEKCSRSSPLAIALTQVKMQLSNQQYEQALATLSRIDKSHAYHPVVMDLQQQVYIALKDWPSLKKLLPQLKDKHIGTETQHQKLELQLYTALLKELVDKKISVDKKYQQLLSWWNSLPSKLKQEFSLRDEYIQQLSLLKRNSEAAEIIEQSLDQYIDLTLHDQWVIKWLEAYGLLVHDMPEKAIKKAESWKKQQPENAGLLLTLGRLYLQNEQWEQALDCFSQGIHIKASLSLYAELGRLHDYLGNTKNSQIICKQGLLSSAPTLLKSKKLDKKS